jgi:hypothetical protein
MARPKKGKPLARCKFMSYIKLSMPPAFKGMILAMGPIMIMNFFISVFFTGSVFSYKAYLFNCDV